MEDRKFTLTVLGVTGFTGQLIMKYLNDLKLANRLNSSLTLCFAGRNLQRMQHLCSSLCPNLKPTLRVVDTSNEISIYQLASDSKGPYELLGEVVIKACVSLGCDYVDITGEGRWAERMKSRYEKIAKQNGVVLIQFAGHDCVPADLCAWFTTSQLSPEELAESHASLITAVQLPAQAPLSNGTLKTILGFTGNMAQYDEITVVNSHLSDSVSLLWEIPERYGGPLVAVPIKLFPDAKIVADSHSKSKVGTFENKHALLLPNRLLGYMCKLGITALPYILHFPFLKTFLENLSDSGQKFSFSLFNTKAPVTYQVFGILKLYSMKGNGNLPPLESIVTRLEFNQEPYRITAITSTQIALGLANDDFRKECPGIQNGGGFHTPVSGIGGQELLERIYECVRFQLISRL